MMNARAWLIALLSLAAVPCSQAAVLNLGTFGDTTHLLGVDARGPITDTFTFNLSGPSDVSARFTPIFGVSHFGWSLDQYNGTVYAPVTGSHGSFSDLSAGAYEFVFDGSVRAPFPLGIYLGHYSVAAVPELDTWLMLLIGAGLLAYQLRRKQKSLTTFSDGLSGLSA